jgi:ParB-like chromosome segregation protein Spo0J
VRVLVESADRWPPILVTADYEVVDGCHRVTAARALGRTRITAEIFTGTAQDAYVESVRRNVAHGLALSLNERRSAAGRILDFKPSWSDRRIGTLAGLSPSTVAALRTAQRGPADPGSAGRLGSDGRTRPTNPAPLRKRITDAIADRPDASLRTIAGLVGASPETVRSVRNRLLAGPPPDTALEANDEPPADRGPAWWERDSALTSTSEGRELAAWLTRTDVEVSGVESLGAIPLSRVYEVSTEFRRRAAFWAEFADALERRATRRATSR